MTLREAIELADMMEDNDLPQKLKVLWLNKVESFLQMEVLLVNVDDAVGYTEGDLDKEMLLRKPHDSLYVSYLVSMIRYAHKEFDDYNNAQEAYNNELRAFTKWFTTFFRPADTHNQSYINRTPATLNDPWRGYYLTAYGLAVKHGFSGSEKEWLESLKGEPAEMRYDHENSAIQWRTRGEDEWETLMTLEEVREGVIEQTLDEARAARDETLQARNDAQTARDEAQYAALAVLEVKNETVAARDEAVTAADAAVGAKEVVVQAGLAAAAAAEEAKEARDESVGARDEAKTAAATSTTAKDTAVQAALKAAQVSELAQVARDEAKAAAEVATAASDRAAASATASETAAANAKADAEAAEESRAGAAAAAKEALDEYILNFGTLRFTGAVEAAYNGSEDVEVHMDWVGIKKSNPITGVLLEETTLSGGFTREITYAMLEGNTELAVTCDGRLFVCIPEFGYSEGDGYYVHVGNKHLFSSSQTDTGEPFFIMGYKGGTNSILNFSTAGEHTMSIYGYKERFEYNKLPEEYLPEGVVRSVNGVAPDESGNVEIDALPDGAEQISMLAEADMLPAVHDTSGAILTDQNGNIILRY